MNKAKLLKKMNETEFEKDDDSNFHIDYITAVANTRARNIVLKKHHDMNVKLLQVKLLQH